MFFNKKAKKVQDTEALEEKHKNMEQEEPLKLEKKDIPALIIAAIVVFLPVLILMVAGILLLFYLFFRKSF